MQENKQTIITMPLKNHTDSNETKPDKTSNEVVSTTSTTTSFDDEKGLKKSKSEGVISKQLHARARSTTTTNARMTKSEGTVVDQESGRERLKRHRVEVAGRVWIPDMWGQEKMLKDWIDCTACDFSLANSSIMSARASMMEEGRLRAANNPTRLRLENSC